jgi:immunoglobulin superfamily member 9B
VNICHLIEVNLSKCHLINLLFMTGREPPVIELFPKESQTLRIGESARFSCRSTSGTPQPTIVWVRRDGQPLSSRFTEDYPGVITLREATIDDAGVYECRASNVAGQTSLSTTLEIQQ